MCGTSLIYIYIYIYIKDQTIHMHEINNTKRQEEAFFCQYHWSLDICLPYSWYSHTNPSSTLNMTSLYKNWMSCGVGVNTRYQDLKKCFHLIINHLVYNLYAGADPARVKQGLIAKPPHFQKIIKFILEFF